MVRRRRVRAGQTVPGVQRVGAVLVLRGIAPVPDVGGPVAVRRRRLSDGHRMDGDCGGRRASRGVRRGGHRASAIDHCRPAEQRVRRAAGPRRPTRQRWRRPVAAREYGRRVRGRGDGGRAGQVSGRRDRPAGPFRGGRCAAGVRAGGRGAGRRRVRDRLRVRDGGGRVPRRRRPPGPVGRGSSDNDDERRTDRPAASAARDSVARLLARLPFGRPPVRVLRARPGRQPDRQRAGVHHVHVLHHELRLQVVHRYRRPFAGLLERGARVSAGVRLVPDRVRIVPRREDQTSGADWPCVGPVRSLLASRDRFNRA